MSNQAVKMHIISPSLDMTKQISVLAQQIEQLNQKLEIMQINIQKIVDAVVPSFEFSTSKCTKDCDYPSIESDKGTDEGADKGTDGVVDKGTDKGSDVDKESLTDRSDEIIAAIMAEMIDAATSEAVSENDSISVNESIQGSDVSESTGETSSTN